MTDVKMPRMSEDEIDALIREQFLCRIAFKGEQHPYIAPFQYALINGYLYFHFTKYGRKIDFLKQENPVCVEIEKYTPNLSEYAFVTITGKLQLVEDPEEKAKAIEKMVMVGMQKLSPNFLLAHGFSKGSEWSSLNADKSILILKLFDVSERKGLKS